MSCRQCLLVLSSVGIVVLSACSDNASKPSAPVTSKSLAPVTSPIAAPASPKPTSASPDHAHADGDKDHDHAKEGDHSGQVIESGDYHLELVTRKEATDTHIDFFLQKGDQHTVIATATVTAQVQQPDGTQTTLKLDYDASGKHYHAVIPTTIAGDYKVVVLSDINGEKINARYTFKQ